MSLLWIQNDKQGFILFIMLVNWKGALSMVVIDLRVFLDLQVSVCELGAFDYLFWKYVFIIYLAVLCLSGSIWYL